MTAAAMAAQIVLDITIVLRVTTAPYAQLHRYTSDVQFGASGQRGLAPKKILFPDCVFRHRSCTL